MSAKLKKLNMKKLLTILLLIVLISCRSTSKPPNSNTDFKNIVGKSVTIGKIEVAQYDFPSFMNWVDATKACADLGDGWRLPTKDELKYLYVNKIAIGEFTNKTYWSSTVVDDETAVGQFFEGDGDYFFQSKNDANFVRAIRTF
jgi:hypothetical protein